MDYDQLDVEDRLISIGNDQYTHYIYIRDIRTLSLTEPVVCHETGHIKTIMNMVGKNFSINCPQDTLENFLSKVYRFLER